MTILNRIYILICIFLFCSVNIVAQYSEIYCKNKPINIQIVQIDNRDSSTIVHLKYTNNNSTQISIDENSYLRDRETNKPYKLLNSINLPIDNDGERRCMILDLENQVHYFCLEYEKIPESIKEFDLIDNSNKKDAFNIYGISYNKEIKKKFINDQDFTASTPVKEYGVYFDNGNAIYYYSHNGLFISISPSFNNDYGKCYSHYVTIENSTGKSVLFNPQLITAEAYIKKKSTYKNLEVFSYDKYLKKVKNKQLWSAAFYQLGENLAASNAGHSRSTSEYSGYEQIKEKSTKSQDSHGRRNRTQNTYSSNYKIHEKSKTEYYDGAAAYAAQQNANKNVDTYLEKQQRSQQQISESYVKVTTIKDQSEYMGYFNIKYSKIDKMILNIPINGNTYSFSIDYAQN